MKDDPKRYTPDWWNARNAILDGIAAESRRRGAEFSEAQVKHSDAAQKCALHDEDGRFEYERNGLNREQWLYKWNPDALDGIRLSPQQMTAMLRDTLRRL